MQTIKSKKMQLMEFMQSSFYSAYLDELDKHLPEKTDRDAKVHDVAIDLLTKWLDYAGVSLDSLRGIMLHEKAATINYIVKKLIVYTEPDGGSDNIVNPPPGIDLPVGHLIEYYLLLQSPARLLTYVKYVKNVRITGAKKYVDQIIALFSAIKADCSLTEKTEGKKMQLMAFMQSPFYSDYLDELDKYLPVKTDREQEVHQVIINLLIKWLDYACLSPDDLKALMLHEKAATINYIVKKVIIYTEPDGGSDNIVNLPPGIYLPVGHLIEYYLLLQRPSELLAYVKTVRIPGAKKYVKQIMALFSAIKTMGDSNPLSSALPSAMDLFE